MSIVVCSVVSHDELLVQQRVTRWTTIIEKSYLLISCRVMSAPPAMLNTMPFALVMGKPRRGEDIAAMAASTARVLPLPVPIPMRAVPIQTQW